MKILRTEERFQDRHLLINSSRLLNKYCIEGHVPPLQIMSLILIFVQIHYKSLYLILIKMTNEIVN